MPLKDSKTLDELKRGINRAKHIFTKATQKLNKDYVKNYEGKKARSTTSKKRT